MEALLCAECRAARWHRLERTDLPGVEPSPPVPLTSRSYRTTMIDVWPRAAGGGSAVLAAVVFDEHATVVIEGLEYARHRHWTPDVG